MKKLLSVLIILLALCACSTSNNNTISIGTSPDYPPYESLDTEGNIIGFEYDFMNAVIEILNEQNNSNYEIEWVQMSFDTIISAVQTGNVDLGVSGFTWSEDRVGQVLFSTPYTDCGIVAVVPADSDIKTLDDLNGKVLAAQMGTTCADAAKTYDPDASEIQSVNVLFANFASGAYDAVIMDKPVALEYAEAEGYVILDEAIEDNATYVIAANDNEELMNKIDQAIEAFMATDAYDALQEEWGLK